MKWLRGYFLSLIGAKQTLGLVGFFLSVFLIGHAVGNLQLLNLDAVTAQASYNSYAAFLMHLKPYLYLIEIGLTCLVLLHAGIALFLKIRNRGAVSCFRYACKHSLCSPASTTMFFTGCLIFTFLVQHLIFFKYGENYLYLSTNGDLMRDMWLTVVLCFSNSWWTVLYVAAMGVLGFHLVHAFPSLLRTFGVVQEKWTPILSFLAHLAGVVLAGVFALTAFGTAILTHCPNTQERIKQSLADQTRLEKMAMERGMR